MNTQKTEHSGKALVTVFEDMESAVKAVELLHEAGFPADRMELVTHDLKEESPNVETPKVHETTATSLIDSAEKWGAAGAGTGAVVGILSSVLTPFPGIIIGGMAIIGGVTGAIVGAMAGIEHAVEDDSVNLPTRDEYEQLLHDGYKLVVVHGSHEDVLRARDVISHLSQVHEHLHPLHGHEFHEHPSGDAAE
jgi:hypothetical protein